MESVSHDNHGDDGSSASPSASGSELFVENENLAIEGEHQSAVDKHELKKNGTGENESKEKKQRATAEEDGGGHVRATVSRKGEPLKDPRVPTAQSKQYLTAYYIKYDAHKHSGLRAPTQSGRELSMSSWAGYPLYAEDVGEISGIPKGCRLDDRTLAVVIEKSGSTKKRSLNAKWPTEFDTNDMIKARRMPLGFAAKMYVNEGDLDRNGDAATRAGWYYKWFRGLHLLCGLEGQEQYLHRPVWEFKLKNTWYFDKNFRCVYQEDERGPLARENFNRVIGTQHRRG